MPEEVTGGGKWQEMLYVLLKRPRTFPLPPRVGGWGTSWTLGSFKLWRKRNGSFRGALLPQDNPPSC